MFNILFKYLCQTFYLSIYAKHFIEIYIANILLNYLSQKFTSKSLFHQLTSQYVSLILK